MLGLFWTTDFVQNTQENQYHAKHRDQFHREPDLLKLFIKRKPEDRDDTDISKTPRQRFASSRSFISKAMRSNNFKELITFTSSMGPNMCDRVFPPRSCIAIARTISM
mmetsp:Transcript_3265/g.6153  ORF Transcript_3265/g.6153 Transcript_3265/m.6153 type:complete len:108 (+) Transcript_3265:1893-2216(+)